MDDTNSSKKVAIYIDGSNFYFSVKKTFNCKVNMGKFCRKLVEKHEITKIGYYTAPVDRTNNPNGYVEQQKFFGKIKRIAKLGIILGRLEKHKKDGKTFYVEKASDINLALDLVLDAQANIYDIAYLISNDGDFSGVVSAVIDKFNKKLVYVAVGTRKMISHHLKKVASSTLKIDKKFVDNVRLEDNRKPNK